MTETPDLVEPIIAWRAWIVAADDGPARLQSLNRTVWPTYEPLQATCRTAHEPPDPRCTCGIYAARDRRQLLSLGYQHYSEDRFVVIGTVSLWGGVVPGEQGWRAQLAYPRSLIVPYEITRVAFALRSEYGVPARLMNTLALTDRHRSD